jgi:hypothetical protein
MPEIPSSETSAESSLLPSLLSASMSPIPVDRATLGWLRGASHVSRRTRWRDCGAWAFLRRQQIQRDKAAKLCILCLPTLDSHFRKHVRISVFSASPNCQPSTSSWSVVKNLTLLIFPLRNEQGTNCSFWKESCK